MILGFKDQFIPYVLDGSKTHTIRGGNRWRYGMRADLFTGPYKPGLRRLIFRVPVVKVERIEVRAINTGLQYVHPMLNIRIGGCELSEDEAIAFAWRDGFRKEVSAWGIGPLHQMYAFWRRTNGRAIDTMVFRGQIIHWDYALRYVPCGDCGRSHPLGPCSPMFRSDWRLPRPTRAAFAAR